MDDSSWRCGHWQADSLFLIESQRSHFISNLLNFFVFIEVLTEGLQILKQMTYQCATVLPSCWNILWTLAWPIIYYLDIFKAAMCYRWLLLKVLSCWVGKFFELKQLNSCSRDVSLFRKSFKILNRLNWLRGFSLIT